MLDVTRYATKKRADNNNWNEKHENEKERQKGAMTNARLIYIKHVII